MRTAFGILFAVVVTVILMPSVSYAQKLFDPPKTEKTESDLFFTYAGAFGAGGYSKVWYTGWVNDSETSTNASGSYYAGGVMLDVFVREIIGEFRIAYMANNSSYDNAKVMCASYSAAAKYTFPVSSIVDFTAGGGLYFEGAPASRSYSGAGGEALFGVIFTLKSWDIKCICDASVRYGFFGQDGKSKKLNVGGSLGVTRKVGRS
jgi:hypothetical protein